MCEVSIHKVEKPQSLCINEVRGEAKGLYTQEDVKKTVEVNVGVDCHGIQRNKFNENNVAVQKLELGQGHDPGVGSAPFVNSIVSSLDTQEGNIVQNNGCAKPENVYASQKIHKDSETSEEKEVSENNAYLTNTNVQNILLFQTDSSPSGNAVSVYDS